jgi:hypothetical protein
MPIQQPTLASQGQVQVQWQARDMHLSERPVSLYYSTSRSGPWNLIEREYANTGSYVWNVPTLGASDQLFVRIEIRDLAGNVGVHESDRPLMIDLTQPDVEVLGVQSLGTLGR